MPNGQVLTVSRPALARAVAARQPRARANHVDTPAAGLLGDAVVASRRLLRIRRQSRDPLFLAVQAPIPVGPRGQLRSVALVRA